MEPDELLDKGRVPPTGCNGDSARALAFVPPVPPTPAPAPAPTVDVAVAPCCCCCCDRDRRDDGLRPLPLGTGGVAGGGGVARLRERRDGCCASLEVLFPFVSLPPRNSEGIAWYIGLLPKL